MKHDILVHFRMGEGCMEGRAEWTGELAWGPDAKMRTMAKVA